MDRQSVGPTIQKWIDAILVDDLENVAKESRALGSWTIDAKSNRLMYRALLNLSHTADRAKPWQTQTGKQIFQITKNLCNHLIEMPDLLRFYAGLYHIVKKLIAMKFYAEAMEITQLSFPSRLIHAFESKHLDMYVKFASLWREPGAELVGALICAFDPTKYKLLLEFFKNELTVLEVIAKDRTTVVLTRVLRYLIKLDGIRVDLRLEGRENHRNLANDFLDRIEVCLGGEDKYDAYHEALEFLNSSTILIKESRERASIVFTESYEMLKAIFVNNIELCSCFLIYKNMAMLIYKSGDNKMEKTEHWDIEKIKKQTIDIMRDFKERKAVLDNMKMIGYVLQPLFDQWDNADKLSFLSRETLREILSLIKLIYLVLNSITTKKCETCTGNNCTLRKCCTVTIVCTRCLVTITKQSSPNLLKDVFDQIKELLEESVASIFEMKQAGCSMWSNLWSSCGTNIYNLSATLHKTHYEETIFLFSLLASCIVKFEGINATRSKINIKDALPYVLYRLSSVHYHKGKYREALTPCALGGLLSYRNTDNKAFRLWGAIKSAAYHSKSIAELTMLRCLKEDMEFISEIGDVNLADYDLRELCVHELRGLHDARSNLQVPMEAAFKQLQDLSCTTLQYAQGVQLLGYHLLHYKFDDNFSACLNRAKRKIKQEECQTDSHLLATPSLDFYTFVRNLRDAADQTKMEMENSKFAVRAPKKEDIIDGRPPKMDCVVPSYSKIKINEHSKLFGDLKQAVDKWSVCIKKNICVPNDWQSVLTLRILVLVAEYSRLHNFTTLENRAWDLAYELSRQLEDSKTCIYVVGRSMLSRRVKNEWVTTGTELMTELEYFSDTETNTAVSFFRVGLSSLYFDIGKHKEAVELLSGILLLPRTHVMNNATSYVSGMVTVLRNHRFCSNDIEGTNYMVFLVRCLYSIAALMDYTPPPRVGVKGKELYTSEVLLTSTSYISIQMNSLLSYREISSHLMNRLKISQAAGATLRVAECLKHLCFIDLSHMQLDDCMVKLQGLEFILQTEYIEESKNTKNPAALTTERGHSNASPILRKTVFKVPDFFSHKDCCNCYKCSCVDYQYLVVSSAHVRAQLYFLQGNNDEALEHFAGAFQLRVKMLEVEKTRENNNGIRYPWNCYYRTVEFVLLLVDFSRCIRVLGSDDRYGIEIAQDAVDFCEQFQLKDHPIYFTAKELLLEYQFYRVFKSEDSYSQFTVPDPEDIDISKFVNLEATVDASNITTPASKGIIKIPKTVRRVKTPPLLKLKKVTMNLSDDEEDEDKKCGTESPKTSRRRPKSYKNYGASKSAPRKKLESYLGGDTDATDSESESDKKIVNEVLKTTSSFYPHLKNELNAITEDKTRKESEKIELMKKLVKHEEISSESETESLESRPRRKKKDEKKNVPKIIVDGVKSLMLDDNHEQKHRERIRTSERIKKSESSIEDVAKIVENGKSSLEDIDESLESDDRSVKENQATGRVLRQRTRSARVLRSRSQTVENISMNNSDIVPPSDHEEVESELSKKLKNLSKLRKSTVVKTEDVQNDGHNGTRKKRLTRETRSKKLL